MSYILCHAGVLAVLFVACGSAEARPLHVRDSTPAAETIVDGRNAQYVVRFDGWVDHAASRMDITENGKVVEPLVPTLDSEADVLAATAPELSLGRYQLHWHAKSIPDGMSRTGSSPSRSRGDLGRSDDFRLAHGADCQIAPAVRAVRIEATSQCS